MVLYVGSAWDLNLDDWHSMAFFQPRPHFSSSIISQLDVWQSGEVLWYWMSSCVIAFCNMFLKPRDKKWSSSLKSITSVAYRFARVVAEVLKETTLSLTTKLPQVGYTNLSTAKTCITSRHMFLLFWGWMVSSPLHSHHGHYNPVCMDSSKIQLQRHQINKYVESLIVAINRFTVLCIDLRGGLCLHSLHSSIFGVLSDVWRVCTI